MTSMNMNLHFENTTTADIPMIRAMENDAENSVFIFQYSVQEHQANIDSDDHKYLKVIDNQGVIVGFIILRGLRTQEDNLELKRIVINAKGKGYGKQTLKLLQNLAFKELNIHRLWLDVFDDNPRAIHVYESVGFIKEGTKRECVKTKEGYRNLILMSILKTEFENS